MTKQSTQEAVGVFIIVSHFALVALVLIAFFAGGMIFEQFTTTIALVVPLFATSTATIIMAFRRRPARSAAHQERPVFVFVAFLVPAALTLYLAAAIVAFVTNHLGDFEQLKGLIAIGETAYGTYLASVVDHLFGKPARTT
jgi:hypothetical protein